jgi:Transposase DDE domain group 1
MRFSFGYELTESVRAAILEIPEDAWIPALDQDGSERENGPVAEITDSIDRRAWPEGSRLVVRRERPHPGAPLSFTDHDGYRFQAILTDQTDEDCAIIERRHRRRARVEDRIRDDKDTGLAKFPFKDFALKRGVVGDRDARARPDRLDPSTRPRREAGQGRAQPDPLPAAARR